jgi:hypothetical protein
VMFSGIFFHVTGSASCAESFQSHQLNHLMDLHYLLGTLKNEKQLKETEVLPVKEVCDISPCVPQCEY